jgi:hypothetical protein
MPIPSAFIRVYQRPLSFSKVFDIGNGTVWPNVLTMEIMSTGKEKNWLCCAPVKTGME